ncbi:MAG: ATP-binding protein [Gemmatimonadota bacterium]
MNDESAFAGSEGAESRPAEFTLELPSDLRMIEAAVGYLVSRCRAFAFEGPRLDLNFRVGVTEAIANAVLYGNSSDPDKTVRVDVSLDDQRVVICVADEGEGFDPAGVPDPTAPGNLDSPGGRGLFLIRKLMDEIEYNDRGNAVRMVLVRTVPARRSGKGKR